MIRKGWCGLIAVTVLVITYKWGNLTIPRTDRYLLTSLRTKSFLSRVRNAEAKPIPVNGYVRLNLLFLLRDKFTHPTVWAEWFKDAKEWIQSNATTAAYFDVTLTLNHDLSADREAFLRTVPQPLLETATVPNPVKCKWGGTTPCMYNVLNASFEENAATNSSYYSDVYAYVSQDAIPVKPFSKMALYLQNNNRSQFYFFDVDYPRSPKHHQWFILSKKHAELLLAHQNIWTNGNLCHWQDNDVLGAIRQAADDEFCPMYTLRNVYTNSTVHPDDLNVESEPRFGYPRVTDLWHDINMGIVPEVSRKGPIKAWGHENKRTFVCWRTDKNCGGVGDCRRGGPCTYEWINATAFEEKLIEGNYWFGRKFPEDLTVKETPNDEKISFDEWLIQKLFHT